MSVISRVTTWSDGQTLTASALNGEINNILNDYNGGITNANISATAAIALSKLATTPATLTGAEVFTNKDLTSGTNTFPTSLVTLTGTQTLTNKRNTKRVVVVSQSATPVINTDNTDIAYITGLAQAVTSFTSSLSGTPAQGDSLVISITDSGTGRALTFGASFESSGNVTLPSTTVAGVRLDIGFLWNIATSKWRCVAVS